MDTNLMALTPSNELHNEFLYYYLLNMQLWRIADTTSIPQINNKHINSIILCLPEFYEQVSIAEVLSDIDSLISSLEKLLEKKQSIKRGAMQELLTGKKRLEGFSGEWEEKTFGELFSFSGGLSASREKLSTEGCCYLHYGDIHGSNKTFIDVTSEFGLIPKLDVPLNSVSRDKLLEDGDVVFAEGELKREAVVANFATTASDGKTYQVDYYNLDVIISVGYRVKSLRGTQFRIWATKRLNEYIIKGFTMNDDLLKKAGGGTYFDELSQDEELAIRLHNKIMREKQDGWRGDPIKSRGMKGIIYSCIGDDEEKIMRIFKIAESQGEY